MCVIIVKPADKRISYRTLRRAYRANPHGWGLCARDTEGNTFVERGIGKTGELVEAYKKYEEMDVVIHCRIKTHGEINLENTHPYYVNDDMWLFHNGTIYESTVPFTDKTMSDTWHYARKVRETIEASPLVGIHPEFDLIGSIGKDVGGQNKIVIVSKHLGIRIANKAAGEERGGVWFSNASAFRGSALHRKRTGQSPPAAVSGGYREGKVWDYKTCAWIDPPRTSTQEVKRLNGPTCTCQDRRFVCLGCRWKIGADRDTGLIPGVPVGEHPQRSSGESAGGTSGGTDQTGNQALESAGNSGGASVPRLVGATKIASVAVPESSSEVDEAIEHIRTESRIIVSVRRSKNITTAEKNEIIQGMLLDIAEHIWEKGYGLMFYFKLTKALPFMVIHLLRSFIEHDLDEYVIGKDVALPESEDLDSSFPLDDDGSWPSIAPDVVNAEDVDALMAARTP